MQEKLANNFAITSIMASVRMGAIETEGIVIVEAQLAG